MLVSFHLFLFLGPSVVGNASAVLSFFWWQALLPTMLALLPVLRSNSSALPCDFHIHNLLVPTFESLSIFGVWEEGINPWCLSQEKTQETWRGFVIFWIIKEGSCKKILKYWLKMAKLKVFFLVFLQIYFLLSLEYFPHILIFTWQITVIFVVVVTITKPHVLYYIRIGKIE